MKSKVIVWAIRDVDIYLMKQHCHLPLGHKTAQTELSKELGGWHGPISVKDIWAFAPLMVSNSAIFVLLQKAWRSISEFNFTALVCIL